MRKMIITLVAALSLALASESVAQPAPQARTPGGPIAVGATHAKKCKRIWNKKKRRRCIKRAGPHTGNTGNSPVFGDEILDDTLELSIRYANRLFYDKTGFPEGTYYYSIPHATCTKLNSTTGRCLIYLWKQAYGSGYGLGGYDRAIWREYYIARRYAPHQYSTVITMVDVLYPYQWVCSDAGYSNVPRCNGYVNW